MTGSFPILGDRRAGGILLHPTSLPGRWGRGDLGPEAQRFLAWLETAGPRVWQMLPIGPPGGGLSPYDSPSVFAIDPLLVSPESLVEDGLVRSATPSRDPAGGVHRTDLDLARERLLLLREARDRFRDGTAPPETIAEIESAREDLGEWAEGWALWSALGSRLGGLPWWRWPEELRDRHPEAVARARRELDGEIDLELTTQAILSVQWERLRRAAGEAGVLLFGDVPIYPARDSVDVWRHRDLFDLDAEGRPRHVAGVPPDLFSATGQRWGNPLYRWEVSAADGHRWWIERLRVQADRFDLLRIDHFRGFAGFWEIPVDEPTAVGGRWRPGPGEPFFRAVEEVLGRLPLVAEDLGEITDDVIELRDTLGLPGMGVLQFAFSASGSDGAGDPHLPHRWNHLTVGYTGTHDNPTAAEWFADLDGERRRRAIAYLGSDPGPHRAMIRSVVTSGAGLAVFPIQDLLGLGPEGRMNRPGEAEGSWRWRLEPGAMESVDAEWLRSLLEAAERVGSREG